MFWEVRVPLLEEAKRSPSLLSDLAGLEQYIAESYDSRSFIELLQNADDAGASRFVIEKCDELLLVANDGRRFTQADFEGLCRSAASSKSRGTSIGYRGIGFKSVVGFARTIHLVSGDLAATFSRELTAKEVPQAARVPLVRVPHPLDDVDLARISRALGPLKDDGFATIFVFDCLLAGAIENEFAAFDPTSVLFLRNVRHVELRTTTELVINVRRDVVDAWTRSIRLASHDGSSHWMVVDRNNIAIAFRREADQIVRLDEREAVVHAFLPTTEPTGLAVKIHGDISTDPSRTRIVLDERTMAGLKDMAAMVVELLDDALSGRQVSDPEGISSALVPITDPRVASLQRRSFKTELLAAMQRSAVGKVDNLSCRPSWLNAADFERLAQARGIRIVPRNFDGIDGLTGLLRFLGAKDASFNELSSALSNTDLTIPGAAEVVAHLIHSQTTKATDARQINPNWRLWPINGKMISLKDAHATGQPLDRDFVDLVTEKSQIVAGLRRLLTDLGSDAAAAVLIPQASATIVSEPTGQFDASQTKPLPASDLRGVPALSLKRWRSAEQQVLHLLGAAGWIVEDVSRQNLGYDIEARTPEGMQVCVEVKSIDYPGQAFTLTSNEEAVARQKGDNFRLAIVRQDGNFLEVAFIGNPVQQLSLTRQCRQWVWECNSYSFAPQRFPLT